MGYFLNKFGITPLSEAEVDGEDQNPNGTDNDYTEDTNDTNQQPPEDNAEGDQQTNEEPAPDEGQQDNPDEEPTTDYTEGDPTEEGEPAPEDGEQPAEGEDPNAEANPVDDIKQKEEELIGLSTQHLDIKHEELKSQFLSMYDMVTSIIERIDDASVRKDNIKVIHYISDTIVKLKSMLTDYIENVYSTRSYIENSVIYNRFLAVLNGVLKILEEMNKNDDK